MGSIFHNTITNSGHTGCYPVLIMYNPFGVWCGGRPALKGQYISARCNTPGKGRRNIMNRLWWLSASCRGDRPVALTRCGGLSSNDQLVYAPTGVLVYTGTRRWCLHQQGCWCIHERGVGACTNRLFMVTERKISGRVRDSRCICLILSCHGCCKGNLFSVST